MNGADLLEGLQLILDPMVLLAIVLGVLIGIVVGLLPGLSGGTALALVLPIVPFLDPIVAIALMVSMYASDGFGGSITAILLKIPGEGGSTATAIEGHALTKAGRAGEAIAVSRAAAIVGGLFGALVLLAVSPWVARWALEFGPAEYLALALFGVSVVASLATGSMWKALIAGWVGFLVATVGLDPTAGHPRFTFGSVQLLSGVNLVWFIVGLFAVSQALGLVSGREKYARYVGKIEVPWTSAWPIVWSRRKFVAVGSVIGVVIGAIPGAGATIAAWLAYGTARRISPEKEQFGSGAMDGLIAPEAAKDSVEGGSLIPTMALAIPGSAGAAIILGGLVLAGLRPGPSFFTEQGGQAAAVMLSLMASSIAFIVLAVIFMKYLIGILRIPGTMWPPIIIMLATFGAYSVTDDMSGAYLAFGIGVVAFLFVINGFPMAAAVLGFVLGPILEENFVRLTRVTTDAGDMASLIASRPIALVLFALTALSLLLQLKKPREVSMTAADTTKT